MSDSTHRTKDLIYRLQNVSKEYYDRCVLQV